MTFITSKATNEELSMVMNRMRKTGGDPLYQEFGPGSIEHFIEGEVKIGREGLYASGFHHNGLSTRGTVKNPPPNGRNKIYVREVEVFNVQKTGNSGKSTMFPDDWGIIKTLDAVSEAYHDPRRIAHPTKSNVFIGKGNGINIEMVIRNNKIVTAYPNK